MKRFSIKEAIMFGWKAFWLNWNVLVAATVTTLFLGVVPEVFVNYLNPRYAFWGTVVNIVESLVTMIVSIGFIKIALKVVDNEQILYSDLFRQWRLFFRYIFAAIIAGIFIVLGLVLFVIPGIVISLRLQFVSYCIIDKNMRIREALVQSWAMTRGNVLRLFLFSLVIGLVSLAGVFALGLGMLVAIPVGNLAVAFVYRKLLKNVS